MRRLAGSTINWFSNTNLVGSPSSVGPHTLFVVIGTPTLPGSGAVYRAMQVATAAVGFASYIEINDAGGVTFQQRNAANTLVYNHTQSSVFSAGGALRTLAMVFDGTNTIAYVDGAQVHSAATTLGARGSFNLYNSQTDANASTSMDIAHAMLFDVALSPAQLLTLGRSRVPVGIPSVNLRGWWPYRGGSFTSLTLDHSRYQQTLNISATAAGAPDEKWVGDMRRGKVILPQYLSQPPIVISAGARSNNPNVSLTSSAVVACTAGASSNCPSATITSGAVVASTASTVSNAPNAAITAGAPVASTAAATSNVPAVTLLNAPVVASTAAAVSNAPSANLSRNLPVVSVAGAASNCPNANISCSAVIASTVSTVTDCPSTSVAGGLGATALSVSNAPAVTLQRNLPIVSVAGAISNATAAVGAGGPVVVAPAANVSNAPAVSLTSNAAVASAVGAQSNAPSATVSTGAVVTSTASTASNCPAAAISRILQVAAVSGSVSDCPPANVVPLLVLPVASVCRSVTDCPLPPPMTFFKDVTAPPIPQRRVWPPRPR